MSELSEVLAEHLPPVSAGDDGSGYIQFVRDDATATRLAAVVLDHLAAKASEVAVAVGDLLDCYPTGCDGLGCSGWDDLVPALRKAVDR